MPVSDPAVPHPYPYRLVARQEVAAPPAAVWAVLADFANVHRWSRAVRHSELVSAQPRGVGCARACHIPGFGRIRETVVDWQEGTGLSYEATPLGPLGPSRNRWQVAPGPSGAVVLVELSYRVRFGLVGRLLHRLVMRRKLARLLREVLGQLAGHVTGPSGARWPVTAGDLAATKPS